MSKQLEFTEQEQNTITDAIMLISQVLLLKMDDGIEKPELEGTLNIDNEDKKVVFSFIAQKK